MLTQEFANILNAARVVRTRGRFVEFESLLDSRLVALTDEHFDLDIEEAAALTLDSQEMVVDQWRRFRPDDYDRRVLELESAEQAKKENLLLDLALFAWDKQSTLLAAGSSFFLGVEQIARSVASNPLAARYGGICAPFSECGSVPSVAESANFVLEGFVFSGVGAGP